MRMLILLVLSIASLPSFAQNSDIVVSIKPKANVLSRCIHSTDQSVLDHRSFQSGQQVTIDDANGEVSYSVDFDVEASIFACETEDARMEFFPLEIGVRLNPTTEGIENPIYDPHFVEKLRISVFAFVVKNLNNALFRMDILSFTRQTIGADLRSPIGTVHAFEIGQMQLEMASSDEDFAFLFDLKISIGIASPTDGLMLNGRERTGHGGHDMVDRLYTAGGIRFNRSFNAKIFGTLDLLTSALVQFGYGVAFNFLPTKSTELSLEIAQRHIFVNGNMAGSTDPVMNATSATLNFRVYFDR